jgi:hypothetical protein
MAIEIIDEPKVLNYLGLSAHPGSTTIVELTNGLVSEAWKNPTDEIPYWVTAIALEVAARPLRNPKGLASWTLSHNDTSRTERLPETAAQAGVYLTDAERARLRGRRRRRWGTIRTAPGY